jgi:serine/threonine protein kinase
MSPENLVGQTLNRYKIMSLLGEGGMGAVYKARDITLQRDVAIKVMHTHFARLPDFQERFLQEARTAARMANPGIVQVYDFGHDRSLLYIVMEFIPGDNLEKMLRDLRSRNEWIYLYEGLEIIKQVSLALDYAHRQGILHRDIKPGNIMIEPEETDGLPYRPVLTDLGLAKLAEGGVHTQDGSSMGTPAYMSPEQAEGKLTDARSDVYSLGVLLYELAVGKLPFPAKTITEARKFHGGTPPPKPISVRPDLPEELENIILKALEKDPDKRYKDAAEFAHALEGIVPASKKVTTPTAAATEATSLITLYQQSLVEERGKSVLEEFAPPTDLTVDKIQILAPDGSTRSITIKRSGMILGRGGDSDIVLDDVKVSRQHARIEFDGSNYLVVDLDSTNGTYLANAKLLPGIAEIWNPDQALRVGNTWFRMARAARDVGTALFLSDGTMVDPSMIYSSMGEGRVGIFLDSTEFSVDPGRSATIPMVILNQGEVVDHFSVGVSGIPESWLIAPPKDVHLMPGQQQEVNLTLQPPRTSESRGGQYATTINVSSVEAPDQVAEVKTTLTVTPFHQFSSEMQPQRIRSGQIGRIVIRNQGNVEDTYNLTLKDHADELEFKPPQFSLKIPEGSSAMAEFKAKTRSSHWIGGQQMHSFSVITQPASGEAKTLSGDVTRKALIPLWLIPVLLFLCMLCTIGSGFAYKMVSDQNRQATQTASALQQTVTAIAVATQQTATAESKSAEDAVQGTIMAKTATAVWLAEDEDKDGLTNQQEEELGTLPNMRDTDGDGLNDGDEIGQGTDPLKADTDGDGLPDGDEVKKGLDPKKVDTDGDGIDDAKDPDPGKAPTLTPTVTITPTPEPPADGVSLNCDDTYQRFRISDAGSLGKTIFVDNWNGSAWETVFSVPSGDPMEKQFMEEAGFYDFGGCEKLVAIPIQYTGSGALLELALFKWTGSELVQVYYNNGPAGVWSIDNDKINFEKSVYLYGEANCCPCYRQIETQRWNGDEFIDPLTAMEPTFNSGERPECVSSGFTIVQVTFQVIDISPFLPLILTPSP